MPRVVIRRPAVWIPAVAGILLLGVIVLRVIDASTPTAGAPTVDQIRQESGIPVTIAPVESGDLAVWRGFNGTVSGLRDAVITARTGDRVVAVSVAVGDAVREGQVVVRQAGEAAQSRLRQAEAAFQQAERTVGRLRPLHEAGAISDQDLDMAVTQLELAEADLAAARDALALSSPLSGTVTEVIARPGMIPEPGDPLVRVANLSQLVVRVRASAREVAEIEPGQPARLRSGFAEGQVRRVALQADPASRLVEVEIAFPPGSGLTPGTLANVEVRIASREDALHVPHAAVRDGMVWIVGQDNLASRRPVQVGLASADRVEILSGLDPGDRVVVQGGSLLSEGARLQVVNGEAEAPGDV